MLKTSQHMKMKAIRDTNCLLVKKVWRKWIQPQKSRKSVILRRKFRGTMSEALLKV